MTILDNLDTAIEEGVLTASRDILQAWGALLVDDMTAFLEKNGKNVTGKLMDSLTFKITEDENSIRFRMVPASHADYIDKGVQGRVINQAPKSPYRFKKQNIAQGVLKIWISKKKAVIQKIANKGIVTRGDLRKKKIKSSIASAEFLIGRAIASRGFEPVPFWSSVLTEERKKELTQALELAIGKTVEVTFDNLKIQKQ